ncbi:MAG: hypothetical protein JEZ14_08300 [Marinilabiliaceae bacterium]|nr:hypothetical protein [Marinilabiliaceae bacterium]
MDNKLQIIEKIREYLHQEPIKKINLLEIADSIGESLSSITSWAPQPEVLAKHLLDSELAALSTILSSESQDSEPAIDSLILTGQEFYENFTRINPAFTICLKDIYPDIYAHFLTKKLHLLKDHIRKNMEKGLASGEYKSTIDTTEIEKKYTRRIEALHTTDQLYAEHFTFDTVFNNIIEEFLWEVATEENWHYFRNRKQLIEVFHFGK